MARKRLYRIFMVLLLTVPVLGVLKPSQGASAKPEIPAVIREEEHWPFNLVEYQYRNGFRVAAFYHGNAWNTRQLSFDLTVKTGGFYDRKDFSGTAHLLEHMLFRRKKEKGASYFSEISNLGGEINAMTSYTRTWFMVDNMPSLENGFTAFAYLYYILSGDPKLALFQGLREKEGLTYSIRSDILDDFSDIILFCVTFKVEPKDLEKARTAAGDIIREMQQKGVEKRDFELCQRYWNDTQIRNLFIGELLSWKDEKGDFNLEKLEAIKEIKEKDVNEAMNKYLPVDKARVYLVKGQEK